MKDRTAVLFQNLQAKMTVAQDQIVALLPIPLTILILNHVVMVLIVEQSQTVPVKMDAVLDHTVVQLAIQSMNPTLNHAAMVLIVEQ